MPSFLADGRVAHDLVDDRAGAALGLLEHGAHGLDGAKEGLKRELDHRCADGAADDDERCSGLHDLGEPAALDQVPHEDSAYPYQQAEDGADVHGVDYFRKVMGGTVMGMGRLE